VEPFATILFAHGTSSNASCIGTAA